MSLDSTPNTLFMSGLRDPKSKKGAPDTESRHGNSFLHRVYSAQRGIETMVSEGANHAVEVDPSFPVSPYPLKLGGAISPKFSGWSVREPLVLQCFLRAAP